MTSRTTLEAAMAGRSNKKQVLISDAIVVVVARNPRDGKTSELTDGLDAGQWAELCAKINNSAAPVGSFHSKEVFVLPDFELWLDTQTKGKEEVKIQIHKNIKLLFERGVGSKGVRPMVVVSCFEKEGEIERMLRRSFEIFLTVHSAGSKALLVHTSDFGSKGDSLS
jgi:hypothetical protein